MDSISQIWRAFNELGLRRVSQYGIYQLGLASGTIQRTTRFSKPLQANTARFLENLEAWPMWTRPAMDIQSAGLEALLAEVEEIIAGKMRYFGTLSLPLELTPAPPLVHWSHQPTAGSTAEKFPPPLDEDIKFVWEPARFTWALVLGRAYCATGDERGPQAFWNYFEAFRAGNPPYQGPNWISAQEAALRLLAFSFAGKIFASSPSSTPERMQQLMQAIADHARRIPPTLAYARAQNNNHLLSEAAGLYAAGRLLMGQPEAGRWLKLGWKWFNRGILEQFEPDGSYSQHSTNYHRLALQLGLWFFAAANQQLPEQTIARLAAATRWLLELTDPDTGSVPNLGPNDGADLLPLSSAGIADFRPVLQAAGLAFLGAAPFPAGPWDELTRWLRIDPARIHAHTAEPKAGEAPSLLVMRAAGSDSWAYLRAARFHNRPGHADQLHLDLWWKRINAAQDAGTYLYNAAPPWDNALTTAAVHNTLTINDTDQMQRTGRFLYLDWAQASPVDHQEAEDHTWQRLAARHDGYRRMGITHQRAVTARDGDRWVVVDTILISNLRLARLHAPFSIRLHWLLPDFPWEMSDSAIRLTATDGTIELALEAQDGVQPGSRQMSIVRGGKLIFGPGPVHPTWGWASPSYGVKIPALAVIFRVAGWPPVNLISEWSFTNKEDKEKYL